MLSNKKKIVHYCQIFVCFVGLLIGIVPISCFLIGIWIYRGCVSIWLKRQNGASFGGLLQRHDALWGVEDETSLSVVHSLILFESNDKESYGTSEDLFRVLQEKVRVWMTQPRLAKMFQQRRVKYGYNYLCNRSIDDIQLQDYVKLAEVPSKEAVLSDDDLKQWISNQYNVKLPADHSNFLEIIVSRKLTKGRDGQMLFPVLLRIHHSLADGVVIVKLLTTNEAPSTIPPKESATPPVLLLLKSTVDGLLKLPQMVLKLHMTDPDVNSIHNDKTSDKSFIDWYFEGNPTSDVGLLHKIKAIKAVESGITFQDVLCSSLSVTLHQYFAEAALKSDLLPPVEEITIGNAVQLGETWRLTNNCAYNFERIPIRPPATVKGDLVAALREIRKRRAEASKWQQANYIMIRISSVLPDRYLRRLLSKNRCSLGLSNIPGPSSVALAGSGFAMRHLSFWTPNRFKTRLGLSVFTLRGLLHLGLGGDRCSFENENDSRVVLDGIVKEIDRMYEVVKEREEVDLK